MFFRFLLVGGSGFCLDAGFTYLLLVLDVSPWLARIPAIVLAMVYTWLANRLFTYRVKTQRSTEEAFRYALVAVLMALFNYLVYFILVSFDVLPMLAVAVATVCQVFLSFHSYRYFVFDRVQRSRI